MPADVWIDNIDIDNAEHLRSLRNGVLKNPFQLFVASKHSSCLMSPMPSDTIVVLEPHGICCNSNDVLSRLVSTLAWGQHSGASHDNDLLEWSQLK